MEGLVDLKAVGRPGAYGGEEERWPEWSFGLRAYVVMAKIIVPEELDRIETREGVIGQIDWPEDTSVEECYVLLPLMHALQGWCADGATTSTARTRV